LVGFIEITDGNHRTPLYRRKKARISKWHTGTKETNY
jgi:hypothetical protein